MCAALRTLVVQLVMILVCGVGTVMAQQAPEAAATQPVDPLIGTWTINLAKSQYPGTPPKAKIRTHDYTIDGMILITYETTDAKGSKSFTHWFMGLDGKEHPEYGRSTGATPIWYLATKAVDTHTKEVIDRRVVAAGRPPQIINYTFAVSPDGRTLTITAKGTNAQGQPTMTVEVYDRVF